MNVDPNVAALTARLTELAITNTSSVVNIKIRSIKARKLDQ